MLKSDAVAYENELVLVTMDNGERHGGRFSSLPGEQGFRLIPDFNWPGSEALDDVPFGAIREMALQR